MSFILDALRKSDQRRRMQQSPELGAAPASLPPARTRRWPILLLVLLLPVIGLALWFAPYSDPLRDRWQAWTDKETDSALPAPPEPLLPEGSRSAGLDDPARTEDQVLEPYAEGRDQPRERIVRDPDEARAEVERMIARQRSSSSGGADPAPGSARPRSLADQRSTQPAPADTAVVAQAPERTHLRGPDREEAARIQERLLEAQRQREQAAQRQAQQLPDEEANAAQALAQGEQGGDREPLSESGPGERQDAVDWSPERAEYLRVWELPLSIRRNLPALSLTIHVFSERPEERFVLINGERFISGEELGEGVRLVDIRREGALVDYRDYRFLLEP